MLVHQSKTEKREASLHGLARTWTQAAVLSERITVVRQYARTQSPVRGRRKGMTILREGGGDATILDHSKSQNWDSAAIQVRCRRARNWDTVGLRST